LKSHFKSGRANLTHILRIKYATGLNEPNYLALQPLISNKTHCVKRTLSNKTLIMKRTITTKKNHISCQFCFENFFRRKYLQILLWKKICKKLLLIFLQNILYKTLSATNFVGNTCKFYNFVGNDYLWRNYLSIKIFTKNGKKPSFLANFFNKLEGKIQCNMIISSSEYLIKFLMTFIKKKCKIEE